jgi:hypothetical protein
MNLGLQMRRPAGTGDPAFDFEFRGCPVLRSGKGGGFDVILKTRSIHTIDANQPGIILRVEGKTTPGPVSGMCD